MLSVNHNAYVIDEKIGSGTFGNVYVVTRQDDKKFAYKESTKTGNLKDLDVGFLREISLLKMVQGNSHGIMSFTDIVLTKDHVGIIMPLYKYDLFHAISHKLLHKQKRYVVAKKLLQAVNFLHENSIIHRDIKTENVMLDENDDPILSDFTLSKIFTDPLVGETHSARTGTVTYRAPEVLKTQTYGLKADIWSLGVLLFELSSNKFISAQTDFGAFAYFQKKFRDTDASMKSMRHIIRGFLQVNPDDRFSIKDVLESPFFKNSNHKAHKSQEQVYQKYSDKVIISEEISFFAECFEVEKDTTKMAAQIYVNESNCSPQCAIQLACKMYETSIESYENEEYVDEEIHILKKMSYNLFV